MLYVKRKYIVPLQKNGCGLLAPMEHLPLRVRYDSAVDITSLTPEYADPFYVFSIIKKKLLTTPMPQRKL